MSYGFAIHTFQDTPEDPIEWLWPDMIPKGMVTLLAGKQGLGKSYLLCSLAARISSGEAMPDGATQPPGKVLMLVREDDPGRVLKPRLKAAGADMDRINWTSLITTANEQASMDFVQACPDLAKLTKNEGFTLIIVDTFAAFAPDGTDANASGDVRKVLDAACRLAGQTGAAVLVVAHLRKPSMRDSDPMDAIAGSVQMSAGVRVALLLDEGRAEGERWLRVVKMNVGNYDRAGWLWRFKAAPPLAPEHTPPTIQWNKAGEAYAHLHEDRRSNRQPVDPDDAANAMLGILEAKGKCLSKTEAQTTLFKALRKTQPGLTKTDAKEAAADLFDDPPAGLEVAKGSRGGLLIGRSGTLPESPEARARRIAQAQPGISCNELAQVARCRKQTAIEILGSRVVVPTDFSSGNQGTANGSVIGSHMRAAPIGRTLVGTGTAANEDSAVPRGAA
jgi:hypothetical protein